MYISPGSCDILKDLDRYQMMHKDGVPICGPRLDGIKACFTNRFVSPVSGVRLGSFVLQRQRNRDFSSDVCGCLSKARVVRSPEKNLSRFRFHFLGLNLTWPNVINTDAVPAGPRYAPCASHSLQARAAISQASSSVPAHSAEVRRSICCRSP